MKTKVLSIIILSASILLCSACTGNNPKKSPASSAPVAQGSVTESVPDKQESSKPASESETSRKESSAADKKTEESSSAEASQSIRQSSDESTPALSDKELKDMETVGDVIAERTSQDDYQNGDINKRSEIALALLNDLADKGLIIKESIYYDGNGGNISFSYSCGALGGIMLREFDPYMNGIPNNNTETSKQTENNNSRSDTSSLTSTISIPQSDKAQLGEKLLDTFIASADEEKGESKGLFNSLIEKIKKSSHTEMAITGNINSDGKFGIISLEKQISGNNKFISTRHNMGDYNFETNQSMIQKNGVTYILNNNNKTYFISEDDDNTDIFDNLFMFGESIGNEISHGKCILDGNEVSFEMFEDSSGMNTVAYFDADSFIKAEIYETKDFGIEIGTATLAGYLYIAADIPVDEGLYEIPSDYKMTENINSTID